MNKKKLMDLAADIIQYILAALLVGFIFKKLGWTNGDIIMYILIATAGLMIVKIVIKRFIKGNK